MDGESSPVSSVFHSKSTVCLGNLRRCTGKEPNSQQIRAPINEKPYPIYDQNYIEIPYNHPTALFAYFQAQNTLENAKNKI